MCLLVTSMLMTNSLLLWWTLDSVPLPFVIRAKVVNEALQWRSELRAQVQSYVSHIEITSELNLQCNHFIRVERHFPMENS